MIRRMMEETRRVVWNGGGHFVLWGVVLVAALLVTFAAVREEWSGWAMWVWPTALAIGWIGSFILGRSEYRRAPVATPGLRVLGAVWVGVGITASILGLLGAGLGAIDPDSLSGVLACVLATGYLATGILYGAGWIGGLAVGWWAGGLVMLAWPGLHTLLVFAGMLVLLQIVPGVVFIRQASRNGGRAAR